MVDMKETKTVSVTPAAMVQLEPPFDQSAELESGLSVRTRFLSGGRAIVALTRPYYTLVTKVRHHKSCSRTTHSFR